MFYLVPMLGMGVNIHVLSGGVFDFSCVTH